MSAPTRYELRLDAIAVTARRGDARPEDVLWLLEQLQRPVRRIRVDIERADYCDTHDSPAGQPAVVTLYGPSELARLLPGAAISSTAAPGKLPPALGVSSKIGSLCSTPERGDSLTYCGCPYCEQPHVERT